MLSIHLIWSIILSYEIRLSGLLFDNETHLEKTLPKETMHQPTAMD